MSSVRVRFAPSPTGTLHVGGARTALFNWLFARHHQGKLILRIEDTDLTRSTKESVKEILDSLNWLGLDWDEGPFYQSERLELYRKNAEKLIREGKAYHSDEIKGEHKAILFKIPHEQVTFHDALRGKVSFDNSLQKDVVLMKSDGSASYQFACVVDDALMKITHVIRGDDHLSNTPKQVPIYQALGHSLPEFAHVPMILGPDGTRLSKRHGATAVDNYREKGIMPEALFNFLSLLGWSPGGDVEVISKEETIKKFEISRLNKKSAIFDAKKLEWMNSVYLKKLPEDVFIHNALSYIREHEKDLLPEEICSGALRLLRERIPSYEVLLGEYRYFFLKSYPVDPDAVEKYLKTNEASSILSQIKQVLEDLPQFDEAEMEKKIRELAEKSQVKAGALIHPLRVAVTGRKVSPGIFETVAVLGRQISLERLDRTINSISA